jgi:2-(3-amino-3-carboxypropyl)histidine synthase
MMFKLEKNRVIEYIRNGKYRRVLLQLPEGMKPKGFELARELERLSGAEIILSADACYGACDLAFNAQAILKADAIVHYGHSPMNGKDGGNVLYIEAKSNVSIDEPLKEALKLLAKERRIGLAMVVQHTDQLSHAARILRGAGKEPHIGKVSGHATYDGQVLGCDYSTSISIANEVDAYVLIGGGDFHAMGIQLATGKRTIVADPYLNQARDMTEAVKLILKKRWAAIAKFQDSKRIGIVIGLKTGQTNIDVSNNVRNLLENLGKECVFLSASECTPEGLESFTDLEAFVITACPRLAIDDQERFRRPILNAEEAFIAAGKKRWEDYGKPIRK